MRLSAKIIKTSLSRYVFLTFLGQPRAKHILLRPFLEIMLPNMLSKSMVLSETSLRKSKKRRTIASVALGGCRALGQLWEAPAELWEASGRPLGTILGKQGPLFSENKSPAGNCAQERMLLKTGGSIFRK